MVVKRLELYSNNMADHHLVTDLLPTLARLTLTQQLGDLHLSPVQQVSIHITRPAAHPGQPHAHPAAGDLHLSPVKQVSI